LGSSFSAYWKLLNKGFRPDIIHAHIYEAGVPAVILGKIFNVPVIITEHFSAFTRQALSNLEIEKAKFAMNRVKLVLPVSEYLQRHIKKHGIHSEFRVIPNTVDTNLFHPLCNESKKKDKKQLLLVGWLSPNKGISYLLRALRYLQENRDDFVLDIVGDGPKRVEYEQMCTELGLQTKVRFHGVKSKQKVAEFMGRCDFFVLPSLWETQSCVLIEAMASGKPIVATEVGGIPEIVNDEIGILVSPKNWKALAKAIDFMLDHYQNYSSERIAQYAQERFSYKVIGRQLNEIYRTLVNQARG